MFRLCRLPVIQRKSYDTASVCLFSSKSSNKLKKKGGRISSEEEQTSSEEVEEMVFKEKEINLLGPTDARTPLPGNVGPVRIVQKDASLSVNNKTVILKREWRGPRRQEVKNELKLRGLLGSDDKLEKERYKNSNLEIVTHKCPQLVGIDFQEMFPYRVFGKNVTLIAFYKRKVNIDSSSTYHYNNNDDVCPGSDCDASTKADDLNDKEILVQDFLRFAALLCKKLREAGYWADYVDPTLDWRQLRHSNNPAVLEVDVRYRKLGLTIEDTGLCKVVSHQNSESTPYIGSLLTNASLDSPKLTKILGILKSC